MPMRYTFGGDEHLFVECSEEMSLEAFFNSLSMTKGVKEAGIRGVTEICPANASFQIKFDPDIIHPDDMLREVRAIEAAAAGSEPVITTRIVEIPVFYNDPWTHETLMRFRERHQDPSGTDLDYAARINDFASVDDFVAAHSGSPWFVSMVGFVSGLPFMYQMVERKRQIQVPKYLRPRTDTPRLTVGHGGCFGCIYSVRGAGGYQMFGITPVPIYDPAAGDVFFKAGDIVKFTGISREEYDSLREDPGELRSAPVTFSLAEFEPDPDAYNARLLDVLG